MAGSKTYDLPMREFLVFYYKYRMRLALAFLVPFALAIVLSFLVTPRYRADSVLVVRLGSEYVYQAEGSGGVGGSAPIPFERDQIYKAEVAILDSTDLHEEAIQSVGLDRMYPVAKPGFIARALGPVRGWLLARLDAVETDDDQSLTAQTIETLRGWLGERDASKLSDDERQKLRLQRAVLRFNKSLTIQLEKESAVINVAFEHKDRDVAIQALDSLLKLYLEKRKQLYLETHVQLAKSQMEEIRRRASNARMAVETFKRQNKIHSLQDQRAALLLQREEVRKQMLTVSNPWLEEKLAGFNHQLDELDALEREFSALEHEVQMTGDEYTLYTHKLDEAQAYDNIERVRAGSVRIIQPPAAPPEPKRYQFLILLAGFIVSLVFMVLAAIVTEFMRSGFLTPERLERSLGLPVLGALPLRKRSS